MLALNTIGGHIRARAPQFPWRCDEFIVRDDKWVNLSRHPPSQPYFYHECLFPSTRKNSKAMVFKPGKKFSIYVVVPEHQWIEMEEFQAKLGGQTQVPDSEPTVEEPATAPELNGNTQATTSTSTDDLFDMPLSHSLARPSGNILVASMTPGPGTTALPRWKGKAPAVLPTQTYKTPSPPYTSATSGLFAVAAAPVHLKGKATQTAPPSQNNKTLSSPDTSAASGGPSSVAGKRCHQQTSSVSSTQSPPHKKHGTASIIPNRDDLKQALLSGGATDIDVQRGKWFAHDTDLAQFLTFTSPKTESRTGGFLSDSNLRHRRTDSWQKCIRYPKCRTSSSHPPFLSLQEGYPWCRRIQSGSTRPDHSQPT